MRCSTAWASPSDGSGDPAAELVLLRCHPGGAVWISPGEVAWVATEAYDGFPAWVSWASTTSRSEVGTRRC